MRYALAVLALLFCSFASRADTITVSGQLTGIPGQTVIYNFTVTSIFINLFGGFIQDRFSGTITSTDANGAIIGSMILDPSNTFDFQPQETITFFECGIFTNIGDPYSIQIMQIGYSFLAGGNGVQIIGTNVGTNVAEPAVFSLLLVGLMCLAVGIRRISA
jgi:hypothetical protein